ncbi:uncharacterized protein E6C27_scaffold74G002520 [Cucumis melo var. makuwa]|uniref:Uncharacterized protein n=1 Tax=Cucumis melo var. makuwa TaxID=1194695 RepID=A0A5A7TP26_CUCMM|nr:uncharacterized protein E6C27_scaffold74G002520 [Cucumis melo var. makuwa]
MCSCTILSIFYEAKLKLRDLGLGYETIHACKYDFVLYWKEFADLQHCPTCGEARLALDEFNPYGQMSTSYNMWSVVLLPYNLPPWKCMKETNFFMSLLILSPRSPGQFFQLHAALLWTINDFPTYGDLSGWSIRGVSKGGSRIACKVALLEGMGRMRILKALRGGSRIACKVGLLEGVERHQWRFPEWFQVQVIELRESKNLSHDFFSLAMGPSYDVRCYNGSIVGGLRFHMSELDSRRTTKNSGLMVIGESDASESGANNFYGVLGEVLHVQYSLGRKAGLFKYWWYDTNVNKSQRTYIELGYTTRDGRIPDAQRRRKKLKNVGISFLDVVYCIGTHVERNASRDEFSMHDQHDVGNTSVDACHCIGNSFSRRLLCLCLSLLGNSFS